MQSIHTIQTVTGPTLAIEMPPAFQGKQVKIVITPMESPNSPARDTGWEETGSPFMEKPELSDEMKKRLAEDPTLQPGHHPRGRRSDRRCNAR